MWLSQTLSGQQRWLLGVQDQAWDLAQLFIWVHFASRTSEHGLLLASAFCPGQLGVGAWQVLGLEQLQ